ncbi:hypothetical protein KI387_039884, partial [Taxus chinensis]
MRGSVSPRQPKVSPTLEPILEEMEEELVTKHFVRTKREKVATPAVGKTITNAQIEGTYLGLELLSEVLKIPK